MEYYKNIIKKGYSRYFFIGLGSQSDVDYSFNYSTEAKKTIYNFIKTVLDNGGGIDLRGYYTAELLKKLGFSENDFDVTGCPSLFINGKNFKINKNENLKKDELKTILKHFLKNTGFRIISEKKTNNKPAYQK